MAKLKRRLFLMTGLSVVKSTMRRKIDSDRLLQPSPVMYICTKIGLNAASLISFFRAVNMKINVLAEKIQYFRKMLNWLILLHYLKYSFYPVKNA